MLGVLNLHHKHNVLFIFYNFVLKTKNKTIKMMLHNQKWKTLQLLFYYNDFAISSAPFNKGYNEP